MPKTPAIVCDLDGTLYNTDERQLRHFSPPGPGPAKKDFNGFNEDAINDKPHFWCAQLVQAMRNAGHTVAFVSGRENIWEREVFWWMKKHLNWAHHEFRLFMRGKGDFRDDCIIKEEIYREHIEPHFEVLFVLDDRKKVVDMWRRIGLTCLQVAPGDF